jgi:hypothetical protein
MPRTPIPDHLIHHPEEVARNAERFDQFCRLAEEIAFPVVQGALVRETTATGAEALTNEAKFALEGLVGEAAAFEDLDGQEVLDEVRSRLSSAIPPPDDEECRALVRDVAQVLTATWLEILRRDLSRAASLLVLSDCLLPEMPSATVKWFIDHVFTMRPKPLQILTDALTPFALSELDAAAIMTTLRTKLFSEPRFVYLPFDLVMAGGPRMQVLAMTRPRLDRLLEQFAKIPAQAKVEHRARERVPAPSAPGLREFASPAARMAIQKVSAYLPSSSYMYLSRARHEMILRGRILASRGWQAITSTKARS